MMDLDAQALINDNVERSRLALEYAERFQGKIVDWGVDDCSMWPAGWLAERLGREIVVPTYNSEAEARVLIAEKGDLGAVWSAIAMRNGIAETNDIQSGDIGVVRMTGFDMGCIFVKYGMAVLLRHDEGVRPIPIRKKHVIKAFRVP